MDEDELKKYNVSLKKRSAIMKLASFLSIEGYTTTPGPQQPMFGNDHADSVSMEQPCEKILNIDSDDTMM